MQHINGIAGRYKSFLARFNVKWRPQKTIIEFLLRPVLPATLTYIKYFEVFIAQKSAWFLPINFKTTFMYLSSTKGC